MRNPILVFTAAALFGVATLGGCNCNKTGTGNDGGGGDGGNPGGDGGRGGDGGNTSDAGNKMCLPVNSHCVAGDTCCNGTCSSGGVCTALCGATGSSCTSPLQCCTSTCDSSGKCGPQCTPTGEACSTNSDCCTQTCTGGMCANIPGQSGCSVVGEPCGNGCCSGDCQNGLCAHQWTCQADNDVCTTNAECCSLNCTGTDGGAGYCNAVKGAGPNCTGDGNPCTSPGFGNECCSHLCEDLGTGTTICVTAEGCSVAGDPCDSTLSCCGNTQGATCSSTCSNVQSCNAPGNICGAPHLPDGGLDTVGSARVDCCPGGGINNEPCFFDPAGIPRCFGQCPPNSPTCDAGCPSINPLVPGCCLSPGETCNSAGECCNFLPCVPNDAGVLTCTAQSCLPVGAICAPVDGGNLCCPGTECAPSGELLFACQTPLTSPDGGSMCLPNTSPCDAGTQCCSAICSSGMCGKPAACQPQGATCTLTGDCCTGLTCVGGTCQTGGACGQAGQSCMPISAADGGSNSTCCFGLSCLDPVTITPCNGTTACNCEIVIQ